RMNELLSIIVPVYNVEMYLKRCVDSILKQDYDNMVIILVDDGSTDSSGVICDQYASNYKNVKVIHKKKRGTFRC
ncbi:glycosyltransferase, partial [Hungatella sp. SL.1.14]|uniref:glycosyltransferase n=1 Tax=Hungatella sp. SL.1.14 TaxID=2963703 RepID=UPI0032E4EB0C